MSDFKKPPLSASNKKKRVQNISGPMVEDIFAKKDYKVSKTFV